MCDSGDDVRRRPRRCWLSVGACWMSLRTGGGRAALAVWHRWRNSLLTCYPIAAWLIAGGWWMRCREFITLLGGASWIELRW